MSPSPHQPVMLRESCEYLTPADGRRIIDGTFGFGGHARHLLEAGASVLGLDLDHDAQAACRALSDTFPKLICCRKSFRDPREAMADAGWETADGILLDLGVSSLQLDAPEKGFTYRSDCALDLRFDRRSGPTAAELIARLSQRELADLIWKYGEEKASRRIAASIVDGGREAPVDTTGRLRDLVADVVSAHKLNATLSRVFQALRIAVNDELGALEQLLEAVPDVLAPGGRLVVISYHSLEDRLVKRWMATESRDCLCPSELPRCICGHTRVIERLTRRAVKAGPEEERLNPRSRSARLRAAERLP